MQLQRFKVQIPRHITLLRMRSVMTYYVDIAPALFCFVSKETIARAGLERPYKVWERPLAISTELEKAPLLRLSESSLLSLFYSIVCCQNGNQV